MNQKNETYQFQDDDLHEQIIAMDNVLATKSTKFTIDEQRLFYITLASIKPNQKSNEIEISKKAMFNMLGFTSHSNYSGIRQMFKKLAFASWIEFGDDEIFDDGFLFSAIRTTKTKVYVKVTEKYIPLLIKLQPGFTRLLSDDAISFTSKFSMILYQQLMRLNNKGDYGVGFTTKELKTLFGLSKEDYMSGGRFDRYNFERKTINLAIKDINDKSKCIQNLRYEKRKKNGRVQGYVFFFDYTDPNEFRTTYNSDKESSSEHATAEEIAELRKMIDELHS